MIDSSLPPRDSTPDDSSRDRECVMAVAILLGAGSAVASLNGEVEVGQVCGVLGVLLAAVAGSLWAAPRLSARRARRGMAGGQRARAAAEPRTPASERRHAT